MSSHSVGSPTTVNGVTVVLYENKALTDEQLKTVTELLKKRLDVSNVTVIQQVEKQKDTTSTAVRLQRSQLRSFLFLQNIIIHFTLL